MAVTVPLMSVGFKFDIVTGSLRTLVPEFPSKMLAAPIDSMV